MAAVLPDAELPVGSASNAVKLAGDCEEEAEVLAAGGARDGLALERTHIDREVHVCADTAVGLSVAKLTAAGGAKGEDLASHRHRERMVVASPDGSDPLPLE